MPKIVTEIRSLARSHTRTALNVLVGVMRTKDATPAARVSPPPTPSWIAAGARPRRRSRMATTARSS